MPLEVVVQKKNKTKKRTKCLYEDLPICDL